LKENPVLIARTSVTKHMRDNGDLAIKFLERKKKDEFSLRSEITGPDGGPMEVKEIKQLDDKALYTLAQGINITAGSVTGVSTEGAGEETLA
jgi:hypothetical protein